MNRHKSASLTPPSTPLLDSYLKPSSTATTKNDLYTKSYSETVGTSPSSYNSDPFTNNLKSSLVFDNYTVDDYKKRDNIYGCFDNYERISDYKSYDTYKYSPPTTSSYGNTYNYGNTNKTDTYTGNNYEIPTSAFSKKTYAADYTSPPSYAPSNYSANSYSTNNYTTNSYSSSNTPTSNSYSNNYSTMSNSERISNSNNMQCNLKESDFKIGKELGKGQFGKVFIVQHKLTGFICALKVIPKSVIK